MRVPTSSATSSENTTVHHVSERDAVAGVALFVMFAALALFSFYSGMQPTNADESTLLWHARILLCGRLKLPLDPHPEFFAMDGMVTLGGWVSRHFVGAPLLFAPFVAARAAWLVNPLLAAVLAIVVYYVSRRMFHTRIARVVMLLLAASPFVLLKAASYTTDMAVAVLAAASLLVAVRSANVSPSSVRRLGALLVAPVCLAFIWLLLGGGATLARPTLRKERIPPSLQADARSLARSYRLHHALVFITEDVRHRTRGRLWSRGFAQGDAERLLAHAPPCALNLALDHEGVLAGRPPRARVPWIMQESARLAALTPRSAECDADAARDLAGTASYVPFFAENEIDADGHVAGDVIWVTDQGAHDEVLRARFGDRTWYRLGARAPGVPLAEALVPYVRSDW